MTCPLVVEQIQSAIGIYRRCRVFAAEPFLPDRMARFRLDARGDAIVVAHEEQVADKDQRWTPWDSLVGCPCDVTFCDITLSVNAHREKWEARTVASANDRHAVEEQWPGRYVHAAVIHFPDFVPRSRIVGDGGDRARTDQLFLAVGLDNGRRAKSLLQIAVVRTVIDIPILLPNRLTSGLFQRHNVLKIEAVVDGDEQISE